MTIGWRHAIGAQSATTGLVLAGMFLHPSHAAAQIEQVPPAPDVKVISPGGVNLRTGLYDHNIEDLSIGDPARGGIELKRGSKTMSPESFQDRMGQFSDNWEIHLDVSSPSPDHSARYISVTAEGVSYSFVAFYDLSNIKLESRTGYASLIRSEVNGTTYWVLTTGSGTVVNFTGGNATSIIRPDGTSHSLTYSSNGLSYVTSNLGYVLQFEYASQNKVSRACAYNLTSQAITSACPANASAVTYNYSGNIMTSSVDALGNVWSYSGDCAKTTVPCTETISRPNESVPQMILNYSLINTQAAVTHQSFSDGRYFDYTWNDVIYGCSYGMTDCNDKSFNLGSGYTENGTLQTSIGFSVSPYSGGRPEAVSPGPTKVTDPLKRTYAFAYCAGTTNCFPPTVVSSSTFPNGVKEAYAYDQYRHIVKWTKSAAPGSSLSDIVTRVFYDNCAATRLIGCDSPTAIIDARGNQTDYTYSSVHGGILTSAAPADSSGLRAVTRYSYVQRYAWVANGAGGFVRAAAPVWLLASESTCRATATDMSTGACAGGTADQTLKTYDYGPDTGTVGNNLLLRGMAMTADDITLRTCYGYDLSGNRIWETKPRAGLASCS